MDAEAGLAELKVESPPAANPVAVYRSFVPVAGNISVELEVVFEIE